MVAPQAQKIHKLFNEQGEVLKNDHVAFRTFNHKKLDIQVFEENLYKHYQYKPIDSYDIPDKNLKAKHFEHITDPEEHPLIFVSEFDINTLNHGNQDTIHHMIDSIDASYDPVQDEKFLIRGRIWDAVTMDEYDDLSMQSQYASWVAVFGYIPNHFTVSVNYLHKYSTLKQVNQFIESNGFALNESGGKIKGTDEIGLMQSSTMAALVEAEFKDGKKMIPGAYYEFAQRFVVEKDNKPVLFRGFVGSQANKIFESTDRR